MNLHEYQSKQLFQEQGIPVPEGKLLSSTDEIPAIVEWLAGQAAMVKAQVHAGGRGKAGGVVEVTNVTELTSAAEKLLGSRLKTHQTGVEGLPIEKLYVEPLTDIASEFYLSLLVDRARKRVAVIASSAGGMSIEDVAAETPEEIFTEFVSPATGLQPFLSRKLAFKLGLEGTQIRAFADLLKRLYQLFLDIDASLIEINPLVTTTAGELVALDAKINLDGSALYRHPDLVEMRDTHQEDEREVYAREHELNYIHLDGDIGCMVNGAGLAMATMDLIKLEGGQPANFLDVGGGTTAARVAEAFKLILSDEHVKAVLVNIFGGIVRCDLIAEGIIKAIEEVHVDVPVVVRLEGTKATEGRQLLADSGLSIIPAENLAKAARQVVAAAREGEA